MDLQEQEDGWYVVKSDKELGPYQHREVAKSLKKTLERKER